ncbi:actin nucleation-promoting factor WASL-like [Columba livia]|uniref:actin nucleation-promoting factor WASL-like n=1 Tax=Columba livia TaxID=8932 RepID=UPI0031BBB80B
MAALPPRPPPDPVTAARPPLPLWLSGLQRDTRSRGLRRARGKGRLQARSAESAPPQPAQNQRAVPHEYPPPDRESPERVLRGSRAECSPGRASAAPQPPPPRATMTEQRAPFPLPPRPVGGPTPLLSPPLRFSSAPPALLSGTEQSAAPVLLPLHREGRRQKRRRTSPASQLTQAQPRRSPAHLPPRSEAAANSSRHSHRSRFLKRPRLPSARSRKEEETTPTPSPFPRLLRGAPLGDWALGRWRKRGSNTRTATPRGRGEGRGRPSRGQAGRESGPGSAAARVRVRRRAGRFCPPREAAAWRDGIPFVTQGCPRPQPQQVPAR